MCDYQDLGSKKISSTETLNLCEICSSNPKLNSENMSSKLKDITNKDISRHTIRRILAENRYFCRITRKKPALTKIQKHLDVATKYLVNVDIFWKNVIFLDEVNFELTTLRNMTKIFRRNREALLDKNIIKTKKYGGGKITIWGCISSNGVGNLVYVPERLNSGSYINILANNLTQSANRMNLNTFIFQQDGALCHRAGRTLNWLKLKQIELLDWASQSPDMNPIENIWKKKLNLKISN